jgi:hypothetical protein
MFGNYQPTAAYRLEGLTHVLEGVHPPALRAFVAAAAYDWDRYLRARSAHSRLGAPAPRPAFVALACGAIGEAARIAHGLRGGAAERQLEQDHALTIDELLGELEQIDAQIEHEDWIPGDSDA